MKKIFTLFLLATTFCLPILAQTVTWNFGTAAPGEANPSSGTPVTNLTISALTQGNNNGTTPLLSTTSASGTYAGASGTYNAGAAARVGPLVTTAGGSAYFEFTLTPASGSTVTLSNISFGTRSTGTGPQAYTIRTFENGVATDFATGAIANTSTWSLKTPPGSVASATAMVVRIYGHEGAGSPGANTANWRIDDLQITVALSGSSADVTPPTLTSTTPANGATGVSRGFTASLAFNESIQKGTGSIVLKKASDGATVQTISLAGSSVTVNNNIATFAINGLDNSTGYYFEIDAGAFTDLAGNSFAGTSGPSTWAFTTIAPPADGIVGNTYTFNACSNFINEGFQIYSVSGAQVWACTRFGRTYPGTGNSADSAIQISGFATTAQVNEDWLISPEFDLSATPIPLLRFYSRTAFAGTGLTLRASANYTGSGDPSAATWVTLNGRFPEEATDVWTLSDSINLSAFSGSSSVYVAWVYRSNTTAAARWTLDDITVYASATSPSPNITAQPSAANFGTVASGATAPWKTFSFTASDFTSDVTFAVPAGFSIGKDSMSPASSIVYTAAEMNGDPKTFFVRFAPTAPNRTYSGAVMATATGYTAALASINGDSYLMSTTLDVVNWNIEWFGAVGSGLGPTNEDLQEANVKTVLRHLNADVYAFSEIVDTARLKRVVDSLGSNYAMVVAEYGSYASDPNDVDYATAQKNGFIYNKDVISNVSVRGLLRYQATAQDSIDAAYWFSSGRFPYLMNATVTLGDASRNISFIAIHGKANTGNAAEQIEAYERRKAGSLALKDTLDNQFGNASIIFVGDFNDDFDETIAPTTGADRVSSYQNFVADSTDANHYVAVTLPLSLNGASSTASFPNVIDHAIISNELSAAYLPNSAAIRTDVATLIANYANTTSDHYPVITRYFLSTATILPVRLVDFTAARLGNAVNLEWTTSQEVNTLHFTVERSADGRTFNTLATVKAAGSPGAGTKYALLDPGPLAGNNYYRLSVTDLDGSKSLSKVIRINFNRNSFSISPNPAKNHFIVTGAIQEQTLVQVIDLAGKIMTSQNVSNENKKVSIAGLTKGLYMVKFITVSGVSTQKLVIE